ncbi:MULTISPECIES: acetyl-CoA C-acetyltransferase [Glutamicibacter]|uniref:Acetyl-CoA C-acyltransferase n=2 Tax=Glutamicibacter arilaitensis TaxID=256701 RepID=A0A2N7S2S9_9MICC|nr:MULTISPECIES: acetyl-CoA C-acetyltransferase [Glutamicibacter]PMQ20449.1 acetyl-CoA C-acyltransferase [Glutamicibacter arilaitensis]CBT76433.1 putative acetyl-CoA C-acyltransferase [Glutamicibacter arilaitensis Re117]HCH47698.1 acetyl-CoA C-acetyltransferase [Glutamicibacter sp.]HCJ55826.1 acetyl-CoA C-acetyltransferase [Glutamicibacter sp.]HCM95612.1 acetyl-CoA C-acetyltransferase [Glutamicibacter sp.]
MTQAYIIDALRTPVGRRGKSLAQLHPLDLAAAPLAELVNRNNIDSEQYDEIILGCIDQLGPQSMDIARNAWLAAGLSDHVPGTTVERQCGSGQQAVSYAAQAVMSGASDLVVAGGVQSMSSIPLSYSNSAAKDFGFPNPYAGSEKWAARYGDQEISQFRGAEMMAQHWGFTRGELEDLAATSHERALHAQAQGYFDREILAMDQLSIDEGPRPVDRAKMASLSPITEGGAHTAATASQMSDGAAMLLIASEAAVKRYGLKPRARIHHASARGDDPVMMLSAPIRATKYALERTGMSIHDMDRIEINEAFAAVVLAWQKEVGADMSKVNVNGGAIALGHPIGATGARLMTSLLHELERSGGRYGLQTMCEGGGQANVTIIERL